MKPQPNISGPPINQLAVLNFEPPEAFSEGPLHFALNRIHLVASNPLLSLQLRISQSPRRRLRPRTRSDLPLLQIPVTVIIFTHLGLRIGGTVTPELIRSGWCSWGSIVVVHLHRPTATIRLWSVIVFHWQSEGPSRKRKKKKKKRITTHHWKWWTPKNVISFWLWLFLLCGFCFLGIIRR